jgi:hypothetical protein
VVASRRAYTGISNARAREIAATKFNEIVSAELVPELELRSNEEVTEYMGPTTAQVQRGPNGPSALVESTLPLRALEDGELRPLNGNLQQEGDHFEAANPLVDVDVPVDLEDGISIRPAGVEAVPAATAPTDGVQVNDNVFYANAAPDTDLIVAPSAIGFELFYQLRSSTSPEQQEVSLRLPSGAQVTAKTDGSAVIEQGGQPLVAIGAPKAWDAAEQPVDVHYEVSGDLLRVVVPHRDRGYLYPIMVDPPFGYYNWSGGDYRTDWWTTYVTPGSPFSSFFSFDSGANKVGVMNRAPGGRSYGQYQMGEWYVVSYADTFIERVDFYNFDQVDASDRPQMCTFEGLWANGWWVNGTAWNAQTNQTSPAGWISVCGNLSFQTRSFWAGSSYYPDGQNTGDPEAPDGSMGLFVLQALENGIPSTKSENVMRSANVWRYDWFPPSISGNPPTGWANDQNTAINFALSDRGVGVRRLQIRKGTSFQGQLVAETVEGCNERQSFQCLSNVTLRAGLLLEGVNNLSAFAVDASDRPSGPLSWTARIDRTKPGLTATGFGGNDQPLESQTNPLVGRDADIRVVASDALSGATSVKLLVDNQVADEITESCPTAGGCTINSSLAPNFANLAPGQHAYKVVALDAAGNSKEIAGSFRLDPALPSLAVSGSLVDADGLPLSTPTAQASIQASDQAVGDSGIASVRVEIDGKNDLANPASCNPTCPGSVSTAYTYTKSSWGEGPHDATFRVTDAAGNAREYSVSVDIQPRPPAAACPSTPPTNLPAADVVTPAVAQSLAPPNAVAASLATYDAVSESWLEPSLEASVSGALQPMDSSYALTNDTIAVAPARGFALGDAACIVPGQTTSQESNGTLANQDALVFANSAPGTDTIARPTASGVTLIASRRTPTSPAALSWTIGLQAGYALQQLSSGAIAIVDPNVAAAGDPVPPRPQNAETAAALNDAAIQLPEARYQLASAEQVTGHLVVAVIARPYSLDALGSPSAAPMTLVGNRITVTAPFGSKALVIPAMRNEKAGRAPRPVPAYYMNVFDKVDLVTKAGEKACDLAGKLQGLPIPASVFVLDFGKAIRFGSQDKQYGAQLRSGPAFNNGEIVDALKEAARKYGTDNVACGLSPRPPLKIAYGTTNNFDPEDTVTSTLQDLGRRHGSQTHSFNKWVRDHFGQVHGLVASDLEPNYGSVTATQTYVDALKNNFGGAFINYGSAGGCPTSASGSLCNNGWTVNDIGKFSWKDGGKPMPQIYTTEAAYQWANIRSQWNSRETFFGVTGSTQVDCHGDPITDANGVKLIKLTPRESWNALERQVGAKAVERNLINIRDVLRAGGPSC